MVSSEQFCVFQEALQELLSNYNLVVKNLGQEEFIAVCFPYLTVLLLCFCLWLNTTALLPLHVLLYVHLCIVCYRLN